MKLIEIPDFAGYYADKEGNIYTTLKQGCRNRKDNLSHAMSEGYMTRNELGQFTHKYKV